MACCSRRRSSRRLTRHRPQGSLASVKVVYGNPPLILFDSEMTLETSIGWRNRSETSR
jgi:hypothetical protein